jgi:hypothetical protein
MRKITEKLAQASLELADNEHSKISERERELFGLSSLRQRALINNLCSTRNTRYLEIGVYRGATLLSALANNPTCRAIGVEDFSYDEREPKKKADPGKIWDNMKSQLYANIDRYKDPDSSVNTDNITIEEKSFENVAWSAHKDIDICFFDVNPVNKETYVKFFDKVLPSLSKEATIVFSNYSNESHAKQIDEVLAERADIEIDFKFHRISGGLSDSTQYYSGILLVGITKKAKEIKKVNNA